MSGVALGTVLLLLVWGTLAGLDLVSVPQAMLSRPLVAATVAGAILGDVDAGLRVGAVLELFALDVLPVGAVRYPDYGPASVGAAAISAGAPWELSLGVAVGIGIVLGGEGPGLPDDVIDRCSARVTIPMAPRVESLNVAVAGAILVYAARRARLAAST